MDVIGQLYRLGGISDRGTLVSLTSRREVDAALRSGAVVRDGRGRYAVPVADAALRSAHALSGVVSHRSAALHWGWEVGTVPALPDVTLPKNRKVPPERGQGVALHRGRVDPGDVDGIVTSRSRTLVDCARSLPFHEALAIADSALRRGDLTPGALRGLTDGLRGTGARQARLVAREATGLAANPFESALRAVALDVPGLDVQPQVLVSERAFSVRPDLVDRARRIVLEADSFAWHGSRRALRTDARRYDNLVVRGWLVLRFSWEDVMHDRVWVRSILLDAVDLVRRRTSGPSRSRRSP